MDNEQIGAVLPDVQACIAWANERPLPDPSTPTVISMLPQSGGVYVRENADGDMETIMLLMGNILWWGLNEIRLVQGMEGVRAFTHRLVNIAFNLDQPIDPHHRGELAVFQPGELDLIQECEKERR